MARQVRDALWTHEGKSTLRYYQQAWYEWDTTRYVERHEHYIETEISKWLGDAVEQYQDKETKIWGVRPLFPTVRGIADVRSLLSYLCAVHSAVMPCYQGAGKFPDAKNVIALANGLIDVEALLDGKEHFYAHTPDWFSATCLPFAYDADAVCPRFDQYMDEILPGDLESQLLLQQWTGYLMVADNAFQKIMILLGGDGRNGKGVYTRLVQKLAGKENYCTPSLADISKDFGKYPFMNKLVAIFGDAESGDRIDTRAVVEFLKSLSGEDSMDINRKYRDVMTGVKLFCRIIRAANITPDLPDASRAIATRLLFVEFKQSFIGREDFDRENKLESELPAIFNWALRGLASLRQQKKFVQPKSGEEVMKIFTESASHIHAFVEDCCLIGEGLWESKDALRYALTCWLEDKGCKPMSENMVTKRLHAVNNRITPSRNRNASGQQEQRYLNISLTKQVKVAISKRSCIKLIP